MAETCGIIEIITNVIQLHLVGYMYMYIYIYREILSHIGRRMNLGMSMGKYECGVLGL
jgi:hypothetical protein